MQPQQLSLPLLETSAEEGQHPAPPSPRDFLQRMAVLSNGRIAKLTLTRNRSTILSAKPLAPRQAATLGGLSKRGLPKRVHLRIHRCFVEASDEVLQAAADFAAKRLTRVQRRECLDVLRDHFDQHAPRLRRPRKRTLNLHGPTGSHHDLQPLYRELNQRYFGGELEVTVSWGSPVKRRRRRRKTIQLGSFQDETQTIRLHPILDRKDVPTYVVESVLHHEMVHAVVPVERAGRRRRVHTAAFREKEREFVHLDKAERWLARHLFRLMGKVERSLNAS